ncbi:MAG TPA: protein translocase subunit SecF [Candidatus Paceibacterota bacterium]
MWIVKHRKIFYALIALITLAAVVSLFTWGLKLGIDFKGGALLEVEYPVGRPVVELIKKNLSTLSLGEFTVRPSGDIGYIIRMRHLSEPERVAVTKALQNNGVKPVEKRFDSIGPLLGAEAVKKAYFSIVLVIIAIVLFITFAFRHVSKPVSSWKYGIIAIVALVHDVVVPTGAFAALGYFYGFEVDTLFVTALLVILGFSIHDTIVVFDRVRENLRRNEQYREHKDFDKIVGEGINQTFVRSINTSLTTLLALVALYMWGPDITRAFSLALLIGITAGTYSSIFLASPLLVTVEKWQKKGK